MEKYCRTCSSSPTVGTAAPVNFPSAQEMSRDDFPTSVVVDGVKTADEEAEREGASVPKMEGSNRAKEDAERRT